MAVAEEIELNQPSPAPVPARTPVESVQAFAKTPMGKNFLRGLGVAALIAIGVALYMWNQPPEYKVLFSNFTDRDGGAITASLDQLGIKHKFSEGGGAILVPSEQVHDARLKLAAQGLPKGGNVGFELMENQKLGVSQFLEQVNFQRALEGELAKSIESVAAVDTARVHLALPKPSVFVRDQQKPTASVLLNLHPGRGLDQLQVSAIVHLVASSVPELLPINVTVVDQAGSLLSNQERDKDRANGIKSLDPNQLKYVQQLQQSVIKQVESILLPIVGEGNVRAEATADVDFSQSEQAAETYKPNSPPEASTIRSQQTSESSGAGNANASGVPGALSNQPPGVATAPLTAEAPGAPGAAAAALPSQKESTTNYEVDKTVRYEQKSMGGLRRLSVAVVVNYRRNIAADGKVTVTPISPAEMVQINNLVKEAMGYNKDRGDSFSVANSPFDGIDRLPESKLEWWRDRANLPLAKELAKFLITALILLYLFIKIVRPMLRPVMRKIDDFGAPPPAIEPELPKTGEENEVLLSEAQLEELEADTARGYRENLAMARKLAQDDPRVVANVIKAWIGNND
ncbi:flagellar basal-body MS-ring/collar protein FliF [Janthinobacterium sp. PC23-8]|uniref:flagellar basal-body MS-ring/collar protein FliF n=1 Tax=Janthinobacterium sp. PC23-8 TaxID=2012679 RepID=UPI000B96E2C4|nr:flagellar basal-body MS-ring/collar protein FliF [Janthinobacterium sp. PC23-8]OYO30444.1 flagellar M-ring protein FliF [Janthinobacterium sp. PC23-8]